MGKCVFGNDYKSLLKLAIPIIIGQLGGYHYRISGYYNGGTA